MAPRPDQIPLRKACAETPEPFFPPGDSCSTLLLSNPGLAEPPLSWTILNDIFQDMLLAWKLRRILFPYRDGLFIGTPKDPEILYVPIIKAFDKAIDDINSHPQFF